MLKINERFSAKRYIRGWELHDTTPTTNPKAKSATSTDVTFYPNFTRACNEVVDRSLGECEKLEDVLKALQVTLEEIKTCCGGVKI